MSKPTADISWGTNTTYDAPTEPYDGTPTKVEPTSGRKANGWEPGFKPTAQETGWWMYFVYLYITWLMGRTFRTQNRLPAPFLATNWGPGINTYSTGIPYLVSSGSGDAYVDLELDVGEQLDSLTFALFGNGTVDGSITIQKQFNDGTAPAPVAAATLTNVAGSAWEDLFMNMLAHTTTGLTVTVGAAPNATYTRSVGDYLAEGFYVGKSVTWAGCVNSANNGTHTIIALTSTVMTTDAPATVAETATAGTSVAAAATLVTADGTFALVAKLTANATGLAAKSMRVVSEVPA